MAESRADTETRTVALAADHAGYLLKNLLAGDIAALGCKVVDLGTNSAESVDYPDFAHALARAVAEGSADLGLVVCGSGIGVGMAVNRHPGVRAAVCHDTVSTRLARQHNDANVLALGARLIGEEVARDCVRTFLTTPFEGGRHERRVAKIEPSA